MEHFWQAALSVAGLGAIATFFIWSLYKQWLKLPIFDVLTRKQQFTLLLVFLILTFLFGLAALGTYITINQKNPVHVTNHKYVWSPKVTYDGRVGGVELENNLPYDISVELWHPDANVANWHPGIPVGAGAGEPWRKETVRAGNSRNITEDLNGSGIAGDWGFKIAGANNRILNLRDVSHWNEAPDHGNWHVIASEFNAKLEE